MREGRAQGETKRELNALISWLTGFDSRQIARFVKKRATLARFFREANLNKNAKRVTGTICGQRIETIRDPLMRTARVPDKLVGNLAKGNHARTAIQNWESLLPRNKPALDLLPSSQV